jgi:hydroxymethylpyrimidine/phosphomethylpyrimidine kinase
MVARVLVVAGSDSGGGAGLQADLKTITMLGGYGMTSVTALTAQNTLGVHGVVAVDPAFVVLQMRTALEDLGADAIKTGMLVDARTIEAVASALDELARGVPLVVDPVMVAKGGAALLAHEATTALTRELLPRATLVTPNAPEAEALTGLRVRTEDDLEPAADRLLSLGAAAVLLKGGHLDGDELTDLLKTARGEVLRLRGRRIESRSTHGTGCTYASAIATFLASGSPLEEAVTRAHLYVRRAILSAPGLGRGHGPLDHAHPLRDGARD